MHRARYQRTARDGGFEIADRTGKFETFDDTAAFVDSLDLVITVCTSVAHLAAALGKPTWILFDANPHWVWQLERTDSPWYTTAMLYRQKEFSKWEPVMADVARDLAALAVTHTGTAPRKRVAKKAAAPPARKSGFREFHPVPHPSPFAGQRPQKARRSPVYATLRFFTQTIRTETRHARVVNGGQKATPGGGVDQKCETILFYRTVF